MHRRTFAAALAFGATIASVLVVGPILDGSGFGAAAARDFYTRKIINGKWITGRFAKGSGLSLRGAARHRLTTRSFGRGAGNTAATPTPTGDTPMPPVRDVSPAPTLALLPAGPKDYAALTTASLAAPGALKESMRPALEARARTLASDTVPAAGLKEPLPILLQPRSVTFDIERGTRTIVYGDDIVVSEPFDPARMRDLARSGPASR